MLPRFCTPFAQARPRRAWRLSWLAIVAFFVAVSGLDNATARAGESERGLGMLAQKKQGSVRLALPMIDPRRGRDLFVSKGCVLCHAVNNVGGRAGPALDVIGDGQHIDILDFTARMWRGAFAMIELQGMELGYQLEFSGEDLGHIIGFLYDGTARRQFSERDVPDLIRDMFIREPYSLGEGLKTEGK